MAKRKPIKISYGRQSISEDDIKAVSEVLRSDWLTQGPKVEEFETALAKYCGAKYAVVFANGTAALHGAYFAASIGKDDEFITSPNTFIATINAGVYMGATPKFVDIEEDTGNIDASAIEAAITPKTKAIVPIDYGGQPVDLDEIREIARKHKLIVIEDACHALGASYKNKKIGGISDMSVFSFHPVKSITTGEGGAVVTNNKGFYDKLKTFRTHGILRIDRWNAPMMVLGYNYRLTDIQSALGLSQLKKLNKFIALRSKIAKKYAKELSRKITIPITRKNRRSSWHLYPIRIPKKLIPQKRQIMEKLLKAGIAVQLHYMPAYFHPYYAEKFKRGLCPKAEEFYAREISIPIYPDLSVKDQNYVIKTLNKILK